MQRLDRVDGRGGARERRDARHLLHHRDPPDRAIVEERLAAERRVDDELNAIVQNLVTHVRASLVDLEDNLDVEPVRAEEARRAARRDQ